MTWVVGGVGKSGMIWDMRNAIAPFIGPRAKIKLVCLPEPIKDCDFYGAPREPLLHIIVSPSPRLYDVA